MTSRTRKLTVGGALVVTVVLASWLWPRNVYRYQGKSVEEWFREYAKVDDRGSASDDAFAAFRAMGTNAVPFLVTRLNRNLAPSWFDRLASRLPKRLRPASKDRQADLAVWLIVHAVRHSVPLSILEPALNSTNPVQRTRADQASGSKRFE